MIQTITDQARYEQTDNHIHIDFRTPHRVISSAVLNGGFSEARHILNLKVPKHSDTPETPSATLTQYCINEGWEGTTVAMMTQRQWVRLDLPKNVFKGSMLPSW